MRNQKGFTLIETLIGIVIFALIGVAIFTGLAATARSNMTNSNLTRAESLARAQMEYVKTQPYNTVDNPPVYLNISIPPGYSFDTSTTPMAARINIDGTPATSETGFQKITVSVKHNNHILFTITDFKVNR